jgi:hypothetical protein
LTEKTNLLAAINWRELRMDLHKLAARGSCEIGAGGSLHLGGSEGKVKISNGNKRGAPPDEGSLSGGKGNFNNQKSWEKRQRQCLCDPAHRFLFVPASIAAAQTKHKHFFRAENHLTQS